MADDNTFLEHLLQKYRSRNIEDYSYELDRLKKSLVKWAGTCYLDIVKSGSIAKGTAILGASDIDFMVSLTNDCREGLKRVLQLYV